MFFSKWTNTLWHIHTMQYYLAIKRNVSVTHAKVDESQRALC